MTRALLIGRDPGCLADFELVDGDPYDAVVIGSLELGELLHFRQEQALKALAEGKRVLLYTPGLPQAPGNRPLAAALAAAQRELKSWGVLFTDGGQRRLVTAQEARELLQKGRLPGPGAVLTPLAKEILEGSH